MQHAVHNQIKVLKTLISKYKGLGEFDYITEEIAERQLKTLERMRVEWEKQAHQECRTGPAPSRTHSPSVDKTRLSACSKSFSLCIGTGKLPRHKYDQCLHQRKICEARAMGWKIETDAPVTV